MTQLLIKQIEMVSEMPSSQISDAIKLECFLYLETLPKTPYIQSIMKRLTSENKDY